MVSSCFIIGCRKHAKKNPGTSFHKIPAIITDTNKKYLRTNGTHCLQEVIELSRIRQKEWVKAIRRGDLTESQLRNARVCSNHFISGKPADLTDRDNPDWVPCKRLGYGCGVIPKEQLAIFDQQNIFFKRKRSSSESSLKDEEEQCVYCNNTFHFADATLKGDHSACWKKLRFNNQIPKVNIEIPELKSERTVLESQSSELENQSSGLKLEEQTLEIHPDSKELIQFYQSGNESLQKIVLPPKNKESSSSSHTSANTLTLYSMQNVKSDSPFESRVEFSGLERKSKLDELIARAVYSSGLPIDMIENYYWKQFFKAIRPFYVLPTARELSGSLLENEYRRVMAEAQKKILNAHSLVLATYGWSSVKGEIHFVVTTPEPVYCKYLLSKGEKNESYISQQIMEVIEKIGNKKLMLLLCDGGSNMKEACTIIAEAYPHITVCESGIDDVKLLLKDIIRLNTVQEILRKAQDMILSINLTESGVRENGQPVKSQIRWGAISTLKTLLENKSVFQADIAPDEMIPEDIRQKILDEDKEYWTEVERLYELMNYIAEGIKTLETDKALLSDIPNVFAGIQAKILSWLDICPLLTEDEKNEIFQIISVREQSTIKPIHCTANLLDPRYRGKDLNNIELERAIDFLMQRCRYLGFKEGSIMSNLVDYRSSKGSYSRTYLWGTAKHISPLEWWKNFCSSQALYRLASQLFSVSPSSIVYQRMFKRNDINSSSHLQMLNAETLGKLIMIRSNLIACVDPKKDILHSILSN